MPPSSGANRPFLNSRQKYLEYENGLENLEIFIDKLPIIRGSARKCAKISTNKVGLK